MSKTEKKSPNRLIDETSTYLLQHAHNPVDWYPWGPEALDKARRENKPILLSVGYSACHWCHVMERESFEEEDTASIMNNYFVNIKVDREERPDVDEIYMKSVQMLTGHGGWPMTVFLTPDLKPFFGGTYFPPDDRHGMPSFKRVLISVKKAWDEQREEVESSSQEIAQHLAMFDRVPEHDQKLSEELLDSAVDDLIAVFDERWGGFGGAPKFPHTASIELLMRRLGRGGQERSRKAFKVIETTLDEMAYGGIQDQIGGGFARYSVDRQWTVPHFEKMLYDNALICRNYLDGYLLTGRRYWLNVARNLLEFVLREMQMPEGGFFCSLDADSQREEGKFYVFTPEEIIEALGESDGRFVCEIWSITSKGNFEHGKSVLRFSDAPQALAHRHGLTEEELFEKLEPLRGKLLDYRAQRVRPGRDEKMLTSWTSLMISAFALGFAVSGEDRYLEAATRAAHFILDNMLAEGNLLRTFGRGKAKLDGYLDDYSYFAQALIDLAAVDSDPRWLSGARHVAGIILDRFADSSDGTFFYTSDQHEEMITRSKMFFDSSLPSPVSVTAMVLLRLSRLTGESKLADIAEAALARFVPYMQKASQQFSNMLCAVDFHLSSKSEIAVVLDGKDGAGRAILESIYSFYLPHSVVLVASVDGGAPSADSPLFHKRGLVENRPTVYICRDFACQRPLTEPGDIRQTLSSLATTAPPSNGNIA